MDFTSINIVYILIALVISITLHETMHAYTSFWLGDDTAKRLGRVSLNPLSHVDPIGTILLPLITLLVFHVPLLIAKPVPFNPNRVKFEEFGAALVGVAGPLTNLVLAIVGAILLRTLGSNLALGMFNFIKVFVEINILLFVFNMIPIPPLDGSRFLYALAPEALQSLMAQLEQFGIFIVFALVLGVPAFSNLLINLDQSLLRIIL